jgi:hypothetical protein
MSLLAQVRASGLALFFEEMVGASQLAISHPFKTGP